MSVDYRPGFETQREELRDERLPVEGSLPAWLRGRYLQNGPGQFEADGSDPSTGSRSSRSSSRWVSKPGR